MLLACHLVGDFIFQTRWQSARKLYDWRYRARHVATYSLAFLPVLLIADDLRRVPFFFFWLFVLHYWTDSRRFYSTLGDVLVWPSRPRREKVREWAEAGRSEGQSSDAVAPNPWPPIALMIDQTLHVAQLAVLGWLLT